MEEDKYTFVRAYAPRLDERRDAVWRTCSLCATTRAACAACSAAARADATRSRSCSCSRSAVARAAAARSNKVCSREPLTPFLGPRRLAELPCSFLLLPMFALTGLAEKLIRSLVNYLRKILLTSLVRMGLAL